MIIQCERCGKEVYRRPSEYKEFRHHYCSPECHYADLGQQVIYCEQCGKPLTHPRRQRERATHHFCSKQCQADWRGEDSRITNPHTGRLRAEAMYDLQPCEVCGKRPQDARIVRHHRDRNTLNNSPENIAFLCCKHHKALHPRRKPIDPESKSDLPEKEQTPCT